MPSLFIWMVELTFVVHDVDPTFLEFTGSSAPAPPRNNGNGDLG